MDWSRWLRQFSRRPAFYNHVATAETSTDSHERPLSFIRQLAAMPTEERRDSLIGHIRTRMEKTLGVAGIEPNHNLMDLGLDSLVAVEFRTWLKTELDCPLGSTLLFDYPTIDALVDYLLHEVLTFADSEREQDTAGHSTLVPIQPQGDQRSLFCIGGILGNVFDFYQLSRYLGTEQPCYGLRSLGLDEDVPPYTRIADIAAHHIAAMQTVQSQGPYALVGYSFGGKVAFEMAHQLLQQGHEVSPLVVIDMSVPVPASEKGISQWDTATIIARFAGMYGKALGKDLGVSHEIPDSDGEEDPFTRLAGRLTASGHPMTATDLKRLISVYRANLQAAEDYVPDKISIPMTFLRASELQSGNDFLPDATATHADPSWGWERLAPTVEIEVTPGSHFTMMTEPHARVLAEQLRTSLAKSLSVLMEKKT